MTLQLHDHTSKTQTTEFQIVYIILFKLSILTKSESQEESYIFILSFASNNLFFKFILLTRYFLSVVFKLTYRPHVKAYNRVISDVHVCITRKYCLTFTHLALTHRI